MRLAFSRCLLAPFLAVSMLAAQKTAPAITVADMRQRLFAIADDSMQGRNTGSLGAFKTADYVASEFKRLGLTPGGEAGGWFQTVPFFLASPAQRSLSVAGAGRLAFGTDYLIAGGAVTNSTVDTAQPPFASAETVYGGAGSDEGNWIDAAKAAGKIVILDARPDSAGRRTALNLTGALRSRFPGALAIAVADLDLRAPDARFRTANPRPSTVATRSVGAILMSITPAAAEMIFGGPTTRLATGSAGKAISGDANLHIAPVPYPARNVIGILPGRDPKLRGEYVSTSGHNDHVGICGVPVDHDSMRAFLRVYRPMGADTPRWTTTPEGDARVRVILDSLRKLRPARADSICNGADDDGTGTVAILELAEYFATLPMAQRPARSLLFVNHTAEEIGLNGSAWFTDHPTVPIDSIVGEIDEDMIGRGKAEDLPKGGPGYLEVVGAKRLSVEFGELLEAANAAQKVPFDFNYEFDVPGHPLQYYCRADHYNYARYGIPAVAFSRGEHLDYHQVTDEPQYIDYEDMARVVTMVRDAIMRVANLDHRPKLDHPKTDPHVRCVQ